MKLEVLGVFTSGCGHMTRGLYTVNMSKYKKLEIKKFPSVSQRDNKEIRFWEKFQVYLVCINYDIQLFSFS